MELFLFIEVVILLIAVVFMIVFFFHFQRMQDASLVSYAEQRVLVEHYRFIALSVTFFLLAKIADMLPFVLSGSFDESMRNTLKYIFEICGMSSIAAAAYQLMRFKKR